jgi:hypothetical protein
MDPNQPFNLMAGAHHAALSHLLRDYPVRRLIDAGVCRDRRAKAASHTNPLLRHGEKYFSQNDEDGILLEILRRAGLAGGAFMEFGVGNGLENNTLILLMSGWRGAWAGGEELAFAIPPGTRNLDYSRVWIARENAWHLWSEAALRLGLPQFDLLSIDLDGNDLYILRELLDRGARPSLVVVEYNGKFPPPIEFCIDYDPAHRFDDTDWCGASLQSFVSLLDGHGFALVACNVTGLNAFFVDRSLLRAFDDVPRAIADLFVPADYAAVTGIGHPPSPRTVASFLRAAL